MLVATTVERMRHSSRVVNTQNQVDIPPSRQYLMLSPPLLPQTRGTGAGRGGVRRGYPGVAIVSSI